MTDHARHSEGQGPVARTDGTGQVRLCDHPDCGLLGAHRAPKSRQNLRSYYWFCLEHIRAYNAAWNYYAGMSETEIERERRNDTTWHRPTWPLRGPREGPIKEPHISDPLDLTGSGERPQPGESTIPLPTGADRKALATLDLTPPVTLASIKRRYKELVKAHHPDANGGDRRAEEKLKAINQAYGHLVQAANA